MTSGDKNGESKAKNGSNRMPADSTFYEKIVPALLIVLAIIMSVLILIAAGVLVGIIPFS